MFTVGASCELVFPCCDRRVDTERHLKESDTSGVHVPTQTIYTTKNRSLYAVWVDVGMVATCVYYDKRRCVPDSLRASLTWTVYGVAYVTAYSW